MNIVVLAGGTSTERDVSIVTSINVCKALRKIGHAANVIDVFYGMESIESTDSFFNENNDLDILAAFLHEKSGDIANDVKLRKKAGAKFFGPSVLEVAKAADIVFMGLHGENGENGKIQATFDLLGIKYTGAGFLSSALSMDKDIAKKVLIPVGVPMPKGVSLEKEEYEEAMLKGLPLPCVVKPACGGSSVGVFICNTEEERKEAIKEAFTFESKILIEEFVKGREFSVGVIEGKALPIVEIVPRDGLYDYKNKYDPEGAQEICPAQLPEDLAKRMQEYAQECLKAVNITSYARVDELVDKDGNIFCLEINTLPGMTPTSLLPKEAAAIGLSYEALVEKLINVSLKYINNDQF